MSPAGPQPRRLLNRYGGVIAVYRVFRLADALEIDEVTVIDIARRRVYFDEVLALTYHRRIGKAFLAVTLPLLVIEALAIGGLALDRDYDAALWLGLVLAAPLFAAVLLRLILKVDVITVFGRRSRAELRFSLRKAKARRIWTELSEAIAAAQQRPAEPLTP